nr:uncharacterized protein LOC108177085 isoform X3 [Oryctolagus cuniculus]
MACRIAPRFSPLDIEASSVEQHWNSCWMNASCVTLETDAEELVKLVGLQTRTSPWLRLDQKRDRGDLVSPHDQDLWSGRMDKLVKTETVQTGQYLVVINNSWLQMVSGWFGFYSQTRKQDCHHSQSFSSNITNPALPGLLP